MNVKTYDGIEDMPISRYQDFNVAVMVQAGIGNDTEALDKHFVTALKYIQDGEKKKAHQTILNLRQSIGLALEKISPETTAFAAWVKEIDGKDVTHLNAEQVSKLLNKNRLTVGYVRQRIEAIKKKLIPRWLFSSRT